MISKRIFREYDIRGKYNIDLFDDDAYLIGKAIGTKLNILDIDSVVVGYDNRLSSVPLEENLVKGLIESSVNVFRLGLVTTPMVYFARHFKELKASIVVTASHNPKEYNGVKVCLNGINNACGLEIMELYDIIYNKKFIDKSKKGIITDIDISDEYVNFLLSDIDIKNTNLKVIYDCGNGTTSVIADRIFKSLGVSTIGIFNTSNPDFPNHHPDPNIKDNLKLLSEKVLFEKADLGVAFDGDGDRVGIINEKGEYVSCEEFSIVIWRSIFDKVTPKKALYDVKCSRVLTDEFDKLGIQKVLNRSGNSYLQKLSFEENIPYAMEESGHTIFRDRNCFFEDAIYTSLRLIEILSLSNKPFSFLYDGISHYYNTSMINFPTSDDKKFIIVDRVKMYCQNKGYNIDLTDGVKVIEEDFSALIRCSNTSPNITYRFEAVSYDKLISVKREFEDLLCLFNNMNDTKND